MDPAKHKRVKEVFNEALDLNPEAREAYVRRVCADDQEVLDEVLSLLANHRDETILLGNTPNIQSEFEADTNHPKKISPRLSDTLLSRKTGFWMERLFGSRKRFGITLIITFVALIFLGIWTHRQVKQSLTDIRTEELRTVLEADVLAMQIWINDFRNSVKSWSRTPEVQDEIQYILSYGNCPSCIEKLQLSPWQDTLTGILRPYLEDTRSAGYNLFDRDGYEMAASKRNVIGNRLNGRGLQALIELRDKDGSFRAPFDPRQVLTFEDPEVTTIYERPIVWAGHPVYSDSGQHIGFFGVGRYSDEGFSQIVDIAEMGKTGETYAFDVKGTMLTNSRFLNDLKKAGLVDSTASTSALKVSLRDPGGNLLDGYSPDRPLASQNFVKPVALSIASAEDTSIPSRGVINEPYRDYRGVLVIGAYHWFPEYNFGLITEVDYEEAFAPLDFLDFTFGIIIAILALVIAYSLYTSLRFVGLRRKVGDAVQLGQYTLVKKIGEGGLGEVYFAQHSMLKRPTAVKMLKPDFSSPEVIARFEREVQLASRLTHPNTIEIYDFGRTPEGVFYYAMEMLNGFTLAQVVQMQGELAPERVIHILHQATASIREAHSVGLIHRDIKPQNIMLVQRGGEDDIVKVLDFGLVKDLTESEASQTRTTQVTGTPLYMAPERIKRPTESDMRSDIYALGAVAYYLLAGRTLFKYSSDLDVIYNVVNTDPESLSTIRPDLPSELVDLVHRCLHKEPEKRPQNVAELYRTIDELKKKYPWDAEDARKWWARFE